MEQRRQNLTGFALGVIRVSALISAFRENTDSQPLQHSAELDLYVFDAQVEEKKQLLYIYNAPHRATKAPRLSLEEAHNDFHVDHNMVIGGRTWKIMARPVASIDEVSPQALLSLFLTLTITAMLTGYMISTVRRAEKIENLVDQRTMELSDASQKAQDREERIRIILETVVDGIITIDEYGTIETFNPAAEHIFLYRGNEVIGQNIKCLMPEPYQTEHDGHLAKYRQTGQTHIIGICRELTGLRKDRSTFPLELTVSEMYVSGQRMFTGVVRDITERKETDRMKEEFISTVSHELRTPLTSIKGSLGLIKSGITGELPAKLDAMLDIAHNNCDRLVRLINDILDMEKITAGKMEFKMSSINMQALLEQAISANQAYADKFNVSFALGDCPENALINGDRDRLMQVLANLLSNAAKFSPEGGLVDIVSIKTEDGFRVEVIDHGSGIPKKFHNQLFKRFSQADSSDNRSKDGTGLGLSISQAIIEHHRGLIGFTSEEGLGSTFYFELPEWNHVQPARIVTPKPQSGHRVLICEDEPDIAALLRLMLEKERYITHIANNAHEARELLQQYTFDAMTLDIGLPDDDGIDLIREIRAEDRTRHLPIIVVSANAVSGETRLNGDAFGIIDWMEKPIDQQRLSEDLRRAVHLSHNGKPRILHLEDDPDVLEIVAHLVEEVGSVTPAKDLNEARHLLQNELFDLVILDLMLPDGDGESILPLLKQPNGTSTPVIVFSAREIHANAIQSIRTVLVKSQTTNQDLLNTIRSAIESVPSASQA